MSNVDSLYPPIEIEFIKVLKELQPIIVKALDSLGGKKPANAGAKYLGVIAKTVNRASDGYLALREAGRMDASKLLIRPALEAVFCGVAAVKDKKFLFRKAYSEWEEHKKLFAKDQAGKDEADKHLKHLLEDFAKYNPDYPTNCSPASTWDAANMAGFLPVYEYAYRMYCKFTHSAISAVSGNLDQQTDLYDTSTMVWCVLTTLRFLKEHTPAEIPDLGVFAQRIALLDVELSKHPPTKRIDVS